MSIPFSCGGSKLLTKDVLFVFEEKVRSLVSSIDLSWFWIRVYTYGLLSLRIFPITANFYCFVIVSEVFGVFDLTLINFASAPPPALDYCKSFLKKGVCRDECTTVFRQSPSLVSRKFVGWDLRTPESLIYLSSVLLSKEGIFGEASKSLDEGRGYI